MAAVNSDLEAFQRDRATLEAALADPARATEAHYLLWEVCHACGDHEAAAAHLAHAIAADPIRSPPAPDTQADRTVLAIAAPGDLQANLPLPMLFDARTELHTLHLADPARVLADPGSAITPRLRELLPRADVAFVAIAEDHRRAAHLAAADALVERLGLPAVNTGAAIGTMSRPGVSQRLAGLEDCVVPRHSIASADTLRRRPVFSPFIVRPAGSHAGAGLARIASRAECRAYLGAHPGIDLFQTAPFVDYRSLDGLYRKYRIVFVAGVPHPLHLAIHDDWAVWYYNAAMHDHPARELEEAAFLSDMPGSLGRRVMASLARIAGAVPLDYFGIDCSVMPDGRLLVFEIETGMIVSDHGRPASGPHPAAAIRTALERLIDSRSSRRKGRAHPRTRTFAPSGSNRGSAMGPDRQDLADPGHPPVRAFHPAARSPRRAAAEAHGAG